MKIKNPYQREAGRKYVWLKGNLHTHSTQSDGAATSFSFWRPHPEF